MAKVKYYYDSETLSYRRIERKKGRKFSIFILSLVGMLLSGLLMFLLYINVPYVDTPREKSLKRELAHMELQYELLDKKMGQAEMVLGEIADRDNNLYRIYFEANPIPDEQRLAGFGGINRYKDLEGFNNSNLIINATRRLDVLKKQIAVQSISLDEIAVLAEEKEKLLAAIPAIQPVNNEDLTRMASGFGYRTDPFTKARKFHYGMDFTARRGTPVYASGDGRVTRADNT
ncbi:MAG: M23 family metallopeptidase, partial [Marinirhabdus sp.]